MKTGALAAGLVTVVAGAALATSLVAAESAPASSSFAGGPAGYSLEPFAMAAPAAPILSLPGLAAGDAAGSAARPATADAAEARAAIEAANSRWLDAFRRGDQAALASIYTSDASLFPPDGHGLEGRDRIVEYFGSRRSEGHSEAALQTLDVVRVGDVAYEVGLYGLSAGPATPSMPAAASADAGRYFAIWKAQADGSWRRQVGIWSSGRGAAPAVN